MTEYLVGVTHTLWWVALAFVLPATICFVVGFIDSCEKRWDVSNISPGTKVAFMWGLYGLIMSVGLLIFMPTGEILRGLMG